MRVRACMRARACVYIHMNYVSRYVGVYTCIYVCVCECVFGMSLILNSAPHTHTHINKDLINYAAIPPK